MESLIEIKSFTPKILHQCTNFINKRKWLETVTLSTKRETITQQYILIS